MTFVRRFLRSDMLRHSLLVLGASVAGNIASFGYHAVVSRKLGVSDYGSLYALISFASVLTLPVAFVPTVITRYAAEFHAKHDGAHMRSLVQFVARWFAGIGCAYVVVVSALTVPISEYLKVAPWTIPVCALLAGITILGSALRAILQGDSDFSAYSLAATFEGFGKLIGGAVLTFAGFGLLGGLFGFLAGVVSAGGVAALRLRRRITGLAEAPLAIDWMRVAQTSWGAIAITVATMILTSADIILVKHFLSAHETGIYSAASLGGKILLFGVGFAAAILLPKATLNYQRGENTRHILWGSLAMLMAVSCIGLLVFHFEGGLLLRALVGRAFSDALPLLTLYGLAMTMLAATGVLSSYAIALHRLSFAIPMVLGAALEIPAIILYHPNATGIVWVVVFTNALVLLLTALGLLYDQVYTQKTLKRL